MTWRVLVSLAVRERARLGMVCILSVYSRLYFTFFSFVFHFPSSSPSLHAFLLPPSFLLPTHPPLLPQFCPPHIEARADSRFVTALRFVVARREDYTRRKRGRVLAAVSPLIATPRPPRGVYEDGRRQGCTTSGGLRALRAGHADTTAPHRDYEGQRDYQRDAEIIHISACARLPTTRPRRWGNGDVSRSQIEREAGTLGH